MSTIPPMLRTGYRTLPQARALVLPCALLFTCCGQRHDEETLDPGSDLAACKATLSTILSEADAARQDSARVAILERGLVSLSGSDAIFCRREVLRDLLGPFERLGRSDRLVGVCEELLSPDMRLRPEPAASVRMELAKACFDLKLPRSFDEAKEVFRYYRENNIRSDRMLEATGLLAATYELTNENEECTAMLTDALGTAVTEKDIRWTCDLLDRLGAIATREGRAMDGAHYHERALDELDRFFRNGTVRDTTLRRAPGAATQPGAPAERRDTVSELLTRTHYLTMRHRALKLLGDALSAAGDKEAGAERYRQAIDLAGTSFIPELVPPFTELGGLRLEQGDAVEAVRLGELARQRATRDHDMGQLLASTGLLHRAYRTLGQEGRALAMLELANAYDDTLNNVGFRMGLLKKQLSYAARADSALMELKVQERDRQMKDEQAKARRNRNATFAVGGAAILLLAASGLWYRSDRRRRLERFEKDAAVLETQALRSQMNPHFIFNALNSINAFVQGNDPDMASSYLSKFARVMRLVLENSRHAEVPLESDLEALRGYLDLERKRMRDKFNYSIHIDPDIDPGEVMVPPLVVQPFVENAIWHGMAGKDGTGHINLRVQRKGEQLLWVIEDDGVGRHAHQAMKDSGTSEFTGVSAAVKKTSLGTAITRARLDLVQKQYGGKAGWNYVDTPTGTRVEVDMPMRLGA